MLIRAWGLMREEEFMEIPTSNMQHPKKIQAPSPELQYPEKFQGQNDRTLAQGRFDGCKQPLNDILDGYALGFGTVIEEDAVAQRGVGERADILDGDMSASFQERAGL